ncbi:X-ray repair cross-complementing protein 5 [Operophtera brumata]|uniref:X-ray repair cross-complementing protein 5 n=1 Tax=Operophtera brumata TaxID=104452 RepID=A0A0L7LLF0_OPEBR|nr:X-ray repair cross-complementing protein 5 [Operophtera brumata]
MDSDSDEESAAAYRGIPATIILINVYDQKTGEISHAATCRMIRQYLRQSRSQYVAVCLFGTEIDDDASMLGDKNVIDIFPLTIPTLEDYKKLQNTKIANVKQDKELKMSNALLHCSKLFANCKKQLSIRTVIMLMRLDTPPMQTDQMPALKRVEDLAESNVDIKLINVSETDHKADDFYIKFLINANKGKDVNLPKPTWDIQEIEKLMYQESHRHLAVARLSFEIGSGMSIGVGVYSLLRDSRQSQKTTYLDRETNAIVTSVKETMKVSTENTSPMAVDGEDERPKEVPLLKSELIYFQEYGGEKVEFTDTEMKYLKNPFGPPMLKLLGFKPASLLSKEKWFLKKGYFLFPNEGIIEGSTLAFKALHQACVKTGMVGICVLCTRVNSRPMNVALSPCSHPLGLDVDTGFDVIIIPFVENVRNLPKMDDDKEDVHISDAHKTVMKDTIEAIKFNYKPDMFEDPKIQSQCRNLEAIALNDEDIEPFVDTTKPSSEKFNGLDDDLFQEIFGPFESDAVKRPHPASTEGGNVKKVKTEIDETLLNSRLASQKVNQYTVAELRQVLKLKDIPNLPALTGLKKAELVELVYNHFQ